MCDEMLTSRDFCEDKMNFCSQSGIHISMINKKDAGTGVCQRVLLVHVAKSILCVHFSIISPLPPIT